MKKYFYLLIFGVLITCQDEPAEASEFTETSENTAEEDQVVVENGIDTLMDCLEALETGDFSNLLIDIYDNVDDDTNDFHEIMIEAIEDIPNYQPLIDSEYPDEPFNVANYFGTYSYNAQTQNWSTSSSNSEMKMVFPLFTNSTSNDTSITLSGVTEELMNVEDPIYIPTSLALDMSHNNQTMFAINVVNVDYSMSGEIPIPNDVDFNIYMNPFTHEFAIDKLADDNFRLSYALSNGSGCVTQFQGTVKLLSTDYENLEDTDIDFINASITTNSMSIEIDIDAEYLFAIDDPTVIQLNNFIDVEVFNDNILLGEIEIREDADEDYYLNMVFIDGTVVNVENFSGIGEDGDVFIQTLEGIFARFIDRLEDE
ncbi:MAG: hypothetical protein P8H23_06235 [Flavobacteriaceae bacterium]|nr:hypothetical protein [Flavobacteriaceae bacterium]